MINFGRVIFLPAISKAQKDEIQEARAPSA